MLIGYSLDSKAYRCYHRESHKVFISFHVSFIESHTSSDTPLLPGLTINNPTHLASPSSSQHASVTDVTADDTQPLPPLTTPAPPITPIDIGP